MKITIKETGEVKELIITDNNGIEWTADLIEAAQFYNSKTEQYEMTEDDYNWWAEYIDNYKSDEQEAVDLAEELGINLDEIKREIQEDLVGVNDLGDEHAVKQSVFEALRNEYK